ncbi:MAG: ABC transporter ATP-binding protein [Eubacteriales bacterium]|nr:ABC transporter ATP-binding protein [Eubacteriales bacterium]
MFKTVKRIIDWCGEFKGRLYIGFVFSFFSTWFMAMPVMAAAYTVGLLIESAKNGTEFDRKWIWMSAVFILAFVLLRFLFDYLRARLQETISYELVARDRLAIGEALKRVSLGYFQQIDTGNILNSITTGLHSLENMGMRMIDSFVGGYLNFLCIFLCLLYFDPLVALIALAGAFLSFFFLLLVSRYSTQNAPVSAKAGRDLTAATLEYARGLPVVKSFGQGGASMAAMEQSCRDCRDICLKIEWGFIPSNCLHLLALKIASVAMAGAACFLGLSGAMSFPLMLLFVFFSFNIFGGLESISDSAHVLGVIDTAMDQLDALREGNYIDKDGKEIALERFDIAFRHVDFGYDERTVLKDVSFILPEKTSTAIVGPSGSGKTTICNLIARFYDVQKGSIVVGGHDVREFTCDSLLRNISMVFQNVYLFHDTIRNNIRFGKPDATDEEVYAAAKAARCHDFILALPNGYDTVVGEGGGTLSGGERQRISIARAMLKDAPIILLDEATASVDPENEHLIQDALSELTRGKTILTIAHRLATIENADQILVIDEGSIVQKGSHEELLQQEGLYREFVRIREKVEGWNIE